MTEIVNSTIHGNTANFHGGGLHFLSTGSPALRSATVSGNTSDNDSNGTGTGGGIRFDGSGAISVRNTVLADNTSAAAPDCSNAGTAALVTAFSHLEATAGACAFAGTGDVTGSDPALEPLADNGGPTRTRRVVASSPLVDGGDPSRLRRPPGEPAGLRPARDRLPAQPRRQRRRDRPLRQGRVREREQRRARVRDRPADHRGGRAAAGHARLHRPRGRRGDLRRRDRPARDGDRHRRRPHLHAGAGLQRHRHDHLHRERRKRAARHRDASTVTVTPVNDAPVAAADGGSTTAGTALTVAAPGLLANDTDVDDDPLTAELATAPANGTVTLSSDGAYVYTPAAGFTGTDTFTYVARDGTVASAPATVTIVVAGPPPLPPPLGSTPPVGGLPSVQPPTAPVVSDLLAVQRGRALRLTLSKPARVTVRLLRNGRASVAGAAASLRPVPAAAASAASSCAPSRARRRPERTR